MVVPNLYTSEWAWRWRRAFIRKPHHPSFKGKFQEEQEAINQLLRSRALFIFLKFIYFYFIIYFWLRWVFVAARRLPLVAESGGYSSLRCAGFSLRWLVFVVEHGL